eukprot:jgi/Mesvir1/9336/Mv25134-RA.3
MSKRKADGVLIAQGGIPSNVAVGTTGGTEAALQPKRGDRPSPAHPDREMAATPGKRPRVDHEVASPGGKGPTAEPASVGQTARPPADACADRPTAATLESQESAALPAAAPAEPAEPQASAGDAGAGNSPSDNQGMASESQGASQEMDGKVRASGPPHSSADEPITTEAPAAHANTDAAHGQLSSDGKAGKALGKPRSTKTRGDRSKSKTPLEVQILGRKVKLDLADDRVPLYELCRRWMHDGAPLKPKSRMPETARPPVPPAPSQEEAEPTPAAASHGPEGSEGGATASTAAAEENPSQGATQKKGDEPSDAHLFPRGPGPASGSAEDYEKCYSTSLSAEELLGAHTQAFSELRKLMQTKRRSQVNASRARLAMLLPERQLIG